MSKQREMLPVWFFIGLLLSTYGVIVVGAGIDEWFHPPAVALSQYHSGIWGGIILLLIGSLYTYTFWPNGRE